MWALAFFGGYVYETVFEVGLNYKVFLPSLTLSVIFFIGILIKRLYKKLKFEGANSLFKLYVGFLVCGFYYAPLLLIVTVFLSGGYDYFYYKSLLNNGEYIVISGEIENYDLSAKYHPRQLVESFSLQGIKFEYSERTISTTFSQVASEGGPIKPGVDVKIYYHPGRKENEIIKLKVKSNANKPLQ